MTPQELTAIAIIGTGFIGWVGFVVGNNRNESKARGRIYGRMDEVKAEIKEDMDKKVDRTVCEIQHKYTNQKLESIDKKMDKLLVKNGLK